MHIITTRSVSFEVALISFNSYSYSMKWYSYSYSYSRPMLRRFVVGPGESKSYSPAGDISLPAAFAAGTLTSLP